MKKKTSLNKKTKTFKRRGLTIILFMSTYFLILFGYAHLNRIRNVNFVLSNKEAYTVQQFTIVDFEYFSNKQSSPAGLFLYGLVDDKKTEIYTNPHFDFNIGDTLDVWFDGIDRSNRRYSNESHAHFIERFENQKKRDYVYIYTSILLWLIIVFLKIRQIKKKKIKN